MPARKEDIPAVTIRFHDDYVGDVQSHLLQLSTIVSSSYKRRTAENWQARHD